MNVAMGTRAREYGVSNFHSTYGDLFGEGAKRGAYGGGLIGGSRGLSGCRAWDGGYHAFSGNLEDILLDIYGNVMFFDFWFERGWSPVGGGSGFGVLVDVIGLSATSITRCEVFEGGNVTSKASSLVFYRNGVFICGVGVVFRVKGFQGSGLGLL